MFKNFRRRNSVSVEEGLHITVANLIDLLEQHPDLTGSITSEQRQTLHKLLPAVAPKPEINNEFEYSLAVTVVQEMRYKLTQRFGILESRWPNMEKHVMAYQELVGMLERYVERNPENADVPATLS